MTDAVKPATAAETEDAKLEEEGIAQARDDDDEDGIPAHILARMTPEERTALNDSDDADDYDDEGDPEEEPGEEVEVVDEDDDPAPTATEAAPAPATGEPVQEQAADEEVVVFPDADPDELDAKINGLKGDLKTARTKFDDGETTSDEYDAEVERITEAMADARAEKREAEKAIQRYQDTWKTTVQAYAGQNPILFSDAHMAGFDREVKTVTRDPAFDGLSHRAKLDLARERYRVTAAATGNPLPDAPAAEKPKPEKKKSHGPKSGLGKIPPTLANVPAADSAGVGNGRWSQIQALMNDPNTPPQQIEKIMRSMSREERDALSSADI